MKFSRTAVVTAIVQGVLRNARAEPKSLHIKGKNSLKAVPLKDSFDEPKGLVVAPAIEDEQDAALISKHKLVEDLEDHVRERFLQIGDYEGRIVGDKNSEFGLAVALDGDTAAVGTPRFYIPSVGSMLGRVYMFVHNGTAWEQTQEISPTVQAAGDQFGISVALDNGRLVVGAIQYATFIAQGNGYACTFIKNAEGVWEEEDRLTASGGGASNDYFGWSVAIQGDVILVGTPGDNDNGNNSGAAYYFSRAGSNSSWAFRQKIKPNVAHANERFAQALSMFNGKAVFGVPFCRDTAFIRSGCAYAFEYDDTTSLFVEKQKVVPGNGFSSSYGSCVAMHGSEMIVGAYTDDSAGSAYIYRYNGTSWAFEDKIVADEGIGNMYFGSSVGIYNGQAVVGANGDRTESIDGTIVQGTGSAFVFNRNEGGNWTQQGPKIVDSDVISQAQLGTRLAIQGDTVVIGGRGIVLFFGTGSGSGSDGAESNEGIDTTAATPAPWDILFDSIATDFGLNSTHQLVLAYRVGEGRDYKAFMYAGGCKATSSENTAIDGIDYSVKNETASGANGLDNLTLSYSFDAASITKSNIWANDTNTLELCMVLQLILGYNPTIPPASGFEDLVIIEDMRNITIAFDLGVDFSIEGNVTLAGATVNTLQQNSSLASFITAFRCSGLGTNEVGSALTPNAELVICMKSLYPDEVEIDEIVSMDIDGYNPAGAPSNLPVIDDTEGVVLESLTSVAYENDRGEAAVTTRVPANLFDFEAATSIAVTGTLAVKLAGGSGRRLAAGGPVRALRADADAADASEAGFKLSIDLRPDPEAGAMGLEGGATVMNSAKAAVGGGLAVLGLLVVSVCALW